MSNEAIGLISRRQAIAAAGGAGLSVVAGVGWRLGTARASENASPTRAAKIELDAAAPAAQKVAVIEQFIRDHGFHESGICYAMQHFDAETGEARPFVPADFEGQSAGQMPSGKPRGPDEHHGENSAWTSGLLLASQVFRIRAVPDKREADDARQLAARAFSSIDRIVRLGESAGRSGFLCKPYGFRVSDETSPDQYTPVSIGLWEYRDLASAPERKRLDEMLPAMADWWAKQNYEQQYFGRTFKGLLSVVHRTIFPVLHHMAWQITKDPKHRDACDKLLEVCGDWPTRFDEVRAKVAAGGSSGWPPEDKGCEYEPARRKFLNHDTEYRSACSTLALCAGYFIRNEPKLAPLMKNVLGRALHDIRVGLRDDYLHLYHVQYDVERDLWRPLHRPPSNSAEKSAVLKWRFFAYASEVCWGDSAVWIPDVCAMAAQHAPEFAPGAMPLARAMWRHLERRRLTHMIDPDGKQLLPELNYMQHTLSSALPIIPLSYWRARAAKLPADEAN